MKRLDAGHEPEGVLRPLFQLQTKLRVVLAREHEGFSDRFEAALRRLRRGSAIFARWLMAAKSVILRTLTGEEG